MKMGGTSRWKEVTLLETQSKAPASISVVRQAGVVCAGNDIIQKCFISQFSQRFTPQGPHTAGPSLNGTCNGRGWTQHIESMTMFMIMICRVECKCYLRSCRSETNNKTTRTTTKKTTEKKTTICIAVIPPQQQLRRRLHHRTGRHRVLHRQWKFMFRHFRHLKIKDDNLLNPVTPVENYRFPMEFLSTKIEFTSNASNDLLFKAWHMPVERTCGVCFETKNAKKMFVIYEITIPRLLMTRALQRRIGRSSCASRLFRFN